MAYAICNSLCLDWGLANRVGPLGMLVLMVNRYVKESAKSPTQCKSSKSGLVISRKIRGPLGINPSNMRWAWFFNRFRQV